MIIELNQNNDIYNKPEEIKQAIKLNQKTLFDKKQLDIYKKEKIDSERFLIEDYINLEVHQESTKNKLKLKTYMMLQNKVKFELPNGVMFMFHGMGAYSGNTANVAKAYSNSGLIVCAYDYRGHGDSEGINGNIESIEEVLSDSILFMEESLSYIKEVIFKTTEQNKEEINKKHNTFLKNKFLSGISMGGLISYLLSKENIKDNFNSVIFYAPAFETYANMLITTFSSIIKYFVPNMPISKSSQFCKNKNYLENPPKEIEKIVVKVKTAALLINVMKPISKERKKYSSSFLLLIGGVDKICTPKSMIDFYEDSISVDKEVWYFPTVWHAIYIEEEINYILPKIEEYIAKRIKV